MKPVKQGKCLSFFLATPADFEFFHSSATGRLQEVEWTQTVGEEEGQLLDNDT